jgi:hypothetical protein
MCILSCGISHLNMEFEMKTKYLFNRHILREPSSLVGNVVSNWQCYVLRAIPVILLIIAKLGA